MGPCFRPVFPRMSRGVGSHETLLPVGRRTAVAVMLLQSLRVVGALIAKQLTKSLQLRTVADQAIPEVMADLVPKVAQQRAVRLLEVHPAPLALKVVGLGDVHRNKARVMSGQRRLIVRGVLV